LLALAGGRLSNEDLFNLQQLAGGLGARTALDTYMAGGDLTAQVGFGPGTNFADMGPETAILVVACDLQEEAPLWWLRVKQAAQRGAKLIVANPRPTKTDRAAAIRLRYPYGAEAATVLAMVNALSAKRPDLPGAARDLERSSELHEAARLFSAAQNGVIVFGSEGAGLESSRALAQACANLLISTDHTGRPNNGLLGVWPRNNDQGAWDMGFRPVPDLKAALQSAKAAYLVATDPLGDRPDLAEGLPFLVVQELFLTPTAKLADVVLPAQPFTAREGSFTNGERRVQRFYPAVPETGTARPDYAIAAQIGRRLGLDLEARSPARILERIAAAIPDYAGLSYARLAAVQPQWPVVGRGDLYYGGTLFENRQGLGVQLAPAAQRGEPVSLGWIQPQAAPASASGLLAVPVTRLYDRGATLLPSQLLHQRLPDPYVVLNPADAGRLGIAAGSPVQVRLPGSAALVAARVDETVPPGVVLVPRSFGLHLPGPAAVEVQAAERAPA
jgi:NADH-quinone oxidoreductase subunit G